MGNICSSSKNKAESSQPGRILGPAPSGATASRAPLPTKSKSKADWKSPGRTLGHGIGDASDVPNAERADARTNAAIAAQKRAESAAGARKGKLRMKLAAQRAQTQAQTLTQVSREQAAARDMDQSSEARRWD